MSRHRFPACKWGWMRRNKLYIDKFVTTYCRNIYDGIPDNVPTACIIDGQKNKTAIYSKAFQLMKKLYVLFELYN
ncbi:hypothetical protein FORMB_17710 [Formosa sp. Hel1_33_131]|jgi:hypothetical protein|nr:hypothetical protein FORMB_17710 [Formosa sp. Hel1_33_131]